MLGNILAKHFGLTLCALKKIKGEHPHLGGNLDMIEGAIKKTLADGLKGIV